jgi:hypothetical protein
VDRGWLKVSNSKLSRKEWFDCVASNFLADLPESNNGT